VNVDRLVCFDKTDDGARLLAAYLAGLQREGIAYKIDHSLTQWAVEITGC